MRFQLHTLKPKEELLHKYTVTMYFFSFSFFKWSERGISCLLCPKSYLYLIQSCDSSINMGTSPQCSYVLFLILIPVVLMFVGYDSNL